MKAQIGLKVNGGKVSLAAHVNGDKFALDFQAPPEAAEAMVLELMESLSKLSTSRSTEAKCESIAPGS